MVCAGVMSPERTHVIAPSPTPSRSGAPIHPTTVYLYEVELTLTGRVSVAMDPEQVTEKRSQLITHPTIDRLTTHWTTLAPITRMLTPSDSIRINSIRLDREFLYLIITTNGFNKSTHTFQYGKALRDKPCDVANCSMRVLVNGFTFVDGRGHLFTRNLHIVELAQIVVITHLAIWKPEAFGQQIAHGSTVRQVIGCFDTPAHDIPVVGCKSAVFQRVFDTTEKKTQILRDLSDFLEDVVLGPRFLVSCYSPLHTLDLFVHVNTLFPDSLQ